MTTRELYKEGMSTQTSTYIHIPEKSNPMVPPVWAVGKTGNRVCDHSKKFQQSL